MRKLLLTALAVLLAASCGPGNNDDASVESEEQAEELVRIAVRVQELQPSILQNYILVNGEIRPESSVDAFADTAGTLIRLDIRRGDRVQQGDVIGEVDPSRPGQRFAASPIRAPISGTVVAVNPRIGSQIAPQTPVASIATTERLEIVSSVPERRISQLRTGTRASVRFDGIPDVSFSARITQLSPVVDPMTRSLETILRFDRHDSRIKPGMFAQVRIITEQRENALVVPQNAVLRRDNSVFVFVLDENDIARRRPVEIGIEIDGMAELRSGAAAGDRVVVRGQNIVDDGSAVRIVEGQ